MRAVIVIGILCLIPLYQQSAQPLIDATPVGGTLTLSGTYVCNCVVSKSITIVGGRILSPNADPVVFVPAKTKDVVFQGVEFSTVDATKPIYDLVRIGQWQDTVLADVPTNITFDNVWIHGQATQEVQRGIAMNGAAITVKNSRVTDIHGKGYDAQALAAWNGPGPFTITDNVIEASGENIMFGGADARIQNLVPSNIQIRRNKIRKPLEWRGVWTAKNLLELKNANNVVIDGNVLENSWGDAQIGFGVLFTVRNQDGTNPWAVVQDVSFTNNTMTNVAGGFQLLGLDYIHPSQQSSRLRIANNIIRLAPEGTLGPNGRLIQFQQFNQVTFENNDSEPPHSFALLVGSDASGTPYTFSAFIYRNNFVGYGQYGLFTDGDKPYTAYAPDGVVTGNYIYGPSIPAAKKLPDNTYFDSKPMLVPAGVGVDMVALQAAQGGDQPTPSPTPTPTPAPSPTPVPSPTPPTTPCVVMAPESVTIPRRGSRSVSVTLSGLTGQNSITTQVSSGQVGVNPRSKSFSGTSVVVGFLVSVKQNSGSVTFITPCGDRVTQVIAQ